MSLTKIDCFLHRGRGADLDTSSYVALNPCQKPGSLVLAGASAARGNIGGQVACRLSLEHFVDGVFQYFLEHVNSNGNGTASTADSVEPSVEILESAFKRANSSVYNFGHQLAAGGRMAASLIGLVIERDIIAAGKVGTGHACLYRADEIFPFFDLADDAAATGKEGYVGENSLVSVELASVPSCEQDLVLLFSASLAAEQLQRMKLVLTELSSEPFVSCNEIGQRLIPIVDDMAFFSVARIGPETIYLKRALH